jgi:hypothetical protein
MEQLGQDCQYLAIHGTNFVEMAGSYGSILTSTGTNFIEQLYLTWTSAERFFSVISKILLSKAAQDAGGTFSSLSGLICNGNE